MEREPHCYELAFVCIFSFLAFLNHHLIPSPYPPHSLHLLIIFNELRSLLGYKFQKFQNWQKFQPSTQGSNWALCL